MQKRTALLILVLVALIAGIAVWRAIDNRAAPTVEPETASNREDAQVEPTPPAASEASLREPAAESAAPASAPPAPAPAPTAAKTMFVRVVDAATGAAIVGARIERSKEEQPDLATEADGRCAIVFERPKSFTIGVETEGPLPRGFCRVHAAGFGIAEFREREGHEREEAALEVKLHKCSTLAIALLGRADSNAGAYEVRARVEAGKLVQNEGATEPEFDFGHIDFRAACDAGGNIQLEGLPAKVPLTVEVFQGAKSVRAVPEPVQLEPGEVRQLQLDLRAACRVLGRILDSNGAGVAKVDVWIARKGDYPIWEFRDYHQKDRIAVARSDPSGAFELGDIPAGAYWLGPGPGSSARARGEPPRDFAALNIPIEIAAGESEKKVELRVQRGLHIRGLVTRPDGALLLDGSGQVFAWHDSGHQASGFWRKDASFQVGPLLPGRYSVNAGGQKGFADSLAVNVEAGASDVVLTLRDGAELTLRVVEQPGGSGVRAELILHTIDGSLTSSTSTDESGQRRLSALIPGTFSVAAIAADGRVGVIPFIELAPGAKVQDVEVVLAPGAKLHVRPSDGVRLASVRVFQGAALVANPQLAQDGAATAIVPAGEVTVRVWIWGSKQDRDQILRVSAGEEREVVIEP